MDGAQDHAREKVKETMAMKNLVLLVALASPTALTSMSSEPLVAGGHSFQPFLVSLTPCPPAHSGLRPCSSGTDAREARVA